MEKLRGELLGLPMLVWTVILGGILLRMIIDKAAPFWGGVTASIAGLFCAVVFTKPTIVISDLPMSHDTMMFVAGLWALFGYSFIKIFIGLADVESLIRIIKAWREK